MPDEYNTQIPECNDFVVSESNPIIIKVVGVGGGGNNAINHMYKQGIKDVAFAVCNTDRQTLNSSPVPTRVLLGNTGLGAGNKPEVGRQAAEDSIDRINELFNDQTKMVFITAGMGGGTGTGAAPVVARIAKERGLLTIGIVTIPFLFEGEKKILKALAGADEMSKYVDALLVINNERLTEIYPDLNFINAFGKADDTLSTAARSISELITCNAHINIDFNDVDTTLRDSGAAIISTGYGDGEHRVTEAINDALNSPLLKNRDITSSKRLLFNLSFSREAEREFKMEEANELTEFISSIDSDVDVIWGMAFDETLGDKVKITILAAGFDITIETKPDTVGKRGKDSIPFVGKAKEEQSTTPSTRMTEEYGERALKAAKARARYIIIQPSQMDDDKFIDAFEKSPTYNREKKKAEEIKEVSKSSSLPIPDEMETAVDSTPSGPTILF